MGLCLCSAPLGSFLSAEMVNGSTAVKKERPFKALWYSAFIQPHIAYAMQAGRQLGMRSPDCHSRDRQHYRKSLKMFFFTLLTYNQSVMCIKSCCSTQTAGPWLQAEKLVSVCRTTQKTNKANIKLTEEDWLNICKTQSVTTNLNLWRELAWKNIVSFFFFLWQWGVRRFETLPL